MHFTACPRCLPFAGLFLVVWAMGGKFSLVTGQMFLMIVVVCANTYRHQIAVVRCCEEIPQHCNSISFFVDASSCSHANKEDCPVRFCWAATNSQIKLTVWPGSFLRLCSPDGLLAAKPGLWLCWGTGASRWNLDVLTMGNADQVL